MTATLARPGVDRELCGRSLAQWRVAQTAIWSVGVAILVALVARPDIGLHAFWNVLIPVAPALFAVAPGLWRNVCPLGSTALFLRHLGLSRRIRVSVEWQGRFALAGVAMLYMIVPLRHVVLDSSGPATAIAISVLGASAVVAGFLFEWKSGWCSGLCPVHPVEKLYGSEPLVELSNAHCRRCEQCVSPCVDATVGMDPLVAARPPTRNVAGTWLVGGFAGFVWGWFQVPDYAPPGGWSHLASAYGWPLAGSVGTLTLFLVVGRVVPARHRRWLVRVFAAAALACYYWYRLPALFGFGPFPGDGMLVDLRAALPAWFPVASRAGTTLLAAWWLVGRTPVRRSWERRPPKAVPGA